VLEKIEVLAVREKAVVACSLEGVLRGVAEMKLEHSVSDSAGTAI
jgi:hypothetical protein